MKPDRTLTGSNLKTAAAWNRGVVLRLLRRHGMLSRRQIAAMVGLRGSTLTYIMRELLERDLVRVVGKLDSKRVGKKQVMLTINPHLGWFLGVALRPLEASLAIFDAAGTLIAERTLPINNSLEAFPAELRKGLKDWKTVTSKLSGKMLGIGVGVPGVVDAGTGMVLRATLFEATRVPLKQLLTDTFGVPVVIDHDACFGAVAEAADGAARGVQHFIHFLVNHEVRGKRVRFNSFGSSFYLGGTLHRGAHFAAGEWRRPLLPPSHDVTVAELGVLRDPDAELTDHLTEFAVAIGQSLGLVVNLIDVQMVVIAGTARIVNRAFLDAVSKEMHHKMVLIDDRTVRVVASGLQTNAVARGAALAAADGTLADSRNMTLTVDPATPPPNGSEFNVLSEPAS